MKKILSLLIALMITGAGVFAAIPVCAVEGLAVAEIDVPYFDVKPTIDGIVSEAEWGEGSVFVSQADVGASKVIVEEDTPQANEFNTFFYRNPAGTYDAVSLNMSYTLWMRWDENNFYIAAKVNDPDGHSLKRGQSDTWNGDSLQVRVDPNGYNSGAVLGPDNFDAEWDAHWESDSIDDMCFGFVQLGTGFTEAWNNYNVASHGGNGNGEGMTAISGGDCKAAVVPAGAVYSSYSQNGITTYEIAVPWHYIDGGKNTYNYADYTKDKTGGIGRELGMSAVVYNADGYSGGTSFNAGLAWGSGIMEKQYKEYPETCGGSNKLTLTADKVSLDSYYDPAYEKNEVGYVPPQPTYNYPTYIDKNHYLKLDYENESDMDLLGYYRDGEWVEEPGKAGNHVARWDLDDGNSGAEGTGYGAGLNATNYLSTATVEEGVTFYETVDCSYTMEYDVMVTGTLGYEQGYDNALYHWFGGASQTNFECGYNFSTNEFYIKNSLTGHVYKTAPAAFSLNEWHHIVFQYYRPSCEIRYYFDPDTAGGRVSPTAVPTISMQYAYFDMPGLSNCEIILRRMNCQIMLDNVEYYNFVNFEKPIVEDADFDVVMREDGSYAVCVKNAEKYRNSAPGNFAIDFTSLSDKVEFIGTNGAADGLGEPFDDNGVVYIPVTNGAAAFNGKGMGEYLIEVLFKLKSGVEKLTPEGFKNSITVQAVYPKSAPTPIPTPDPVPNPGSGGGSTGGTAAQTGDTEIMLILCAVPLAGIVIFGVTVYLRRRRRIDF